MDLKPSATLELHIEELVLHGFPVGDQFAIGDAVQRELLRLIAEQGLPGLIRNPVSVDRLDGGGFNVAADAEASTIGRQLAGSVCRGWLGLHAAQRQPGRGTQTLGTGVLPTAPCVEPTSKETRR